MKTKVIDSYLFLFLFLRNKSLSSKDKLKFHLQFEKVILFFTRIVGSYPAKNYELKVAD